MIVFKDFRSHVHGVLIRDSNDSSKLDEHVIFTIFQVNNDKEQHEQTNSSALTSREELLLLSVARKCLREPSSEHAVVVTYYILNALARVAFEEDMLLHILKLIYHLISIASTSSSHKTIAIQGFQSLNTALTKLIAKQHQQQRPFTANVDSTTTHNNIRKRRRKKVISNTEEENNHVKENNDMSNKNSSNDDDDGDKFSVALLQVPTHPINTNDMNFRQICKLVIGSIFNVSQLLLLTSDDDETATATVFHILTNNAMPWLRLLLQQGEEEKAKSDVILYAHSCYRMVWDYSLATKNKTKKDVVVIQSFAIQCLFLITNNKNMEEQQLLPLPEKLFDSTCQDVFKSMIQHDATNTSLQEALLSFHKTIGSLLDRYVPLSSLKSSPMSYIEYCFIRAVHLSSRTITTFAYKQNDPFTLFPFVTTNNDSLPSIVLSTIYIYLSCQQQEQLQEKQQQLLPMLQYNCEKFYSLMLKEDTQILYKCWKLFHHLKLAHIAADRMNTTNEAAAAREIQTNNILLLLIAPILNACVAPLSLCLLTSIATKHPNNSDSALLENNNALLLISTEEKVTVSKLLDMIFQNATTTKKTISSENNNNTIHFLTTAVDSWMKAAFIYDQLEQYNDANICFMKAAFCCHRKTQLLQIVSKGIATIGRKRLTNTNSKTKTAILPLLLSCHFFSQLLENNKEKEEMKNLALRYSCLASSLPFNYTKEAMIAYAMSIRYHLLSSPPSCDSDDDSIIDIPTHLALLSISLLENNNPAIATLDKLHRRVFRNKNSVANNNNNDDDNNDDDDDTIIQQVFAYSNIHVTCDKNTNVASLLLAVTNNNVTFFSMLHLLRTCISFIGKEYQRQIWMKTTCEDGTNSIWNEFEESLKESVLFVDNSSSPTTRQQLLAKSSMYLVAANSLLPTMQESSFFSSKKRENAPSLLHALVYKSFCILKIALDVLFQIVHDDDERILIYLSSTSMLLVELSHYDRSRMTMPPELLCSKTNDQDSPFVYILNICSKATVLAISSGTMNEPNTIQSLTKTLCLLHTNFFNSGSMINAAKAAYHASLLIDSHSAMLLASSSTAAAVAVAAGSNALVEGELYDSSYKCLFSSNIYEHQQTPRCISSLEDCIQLDRIALKAALEIQCGLYSDGPADVLLSILSTIQQFVRTSNNSESTITDNDDDVDDIAVFASWIRTTCLLFIAAANEKKGNLVDSISALKECSAVCKENIKLCRRRRRPAAQEKIPIAAQFHIFIVPRWTGRLSSCLMSMAICYSRLGDRRRAEGYSLASIEVLGLNVDDDDEQYASAWLSCREKGALREFWQVKELSSSLAKMSNDQRDFVLHSTDDDDANSSVAGLHWKVEFIRSLIHRGDKLKRCATGGVDNGFSECFSIAHQLLAPLLTVQCGSLINDEIGFSFCNTFALDKQQMVFDSARFDGRLGALDSSVKLRLARCIELNMGNVLSMDNDDAERLYEEVRQSPYSNGRDRVRSCYRLGRIFLEKARRSGDLARLWEGHVGFVEPSIDSEPFTNNDMHGVSCSTSLEGEYSGDDLSRASIFLKEANSYAGESTEKLTRHILRSLALVLGPSKALSNPSSCDCLSEAALLVHLSTGGSSRQMVSRIYADGAEFLSTGDNKVKAVFEAFTTDILESDELLQNFMQMLSLLPCEWMVAALTLAPSGEMMISTIQVNADGRLHAKVRCIFPPYNGDTNHYFRDVLEKIGTILEANRMQLSGMDSSAAKNFNKEATQKWWQDRKNIDAELKMLIDFFEKRCFRSQCIIDLFYPQAVEQTLSSDIYNVGKEADCIEMRNLVAKFEQACDTREEEILPVPFSKQDLQKFTVVQLKEKLETVYTVENKVTRRMKKVELIDLVLSEQQRQNHRIHCSSGSLKVSSCGNASNSTSHRPSSDACSPPDMPLPIKSTSLRSCTILVLDERLHRFPWENLAMFRGKQVCRVPSLPFVIAPLVEFGHQQRVVDPNYTTYLIDPESNLLSTSHKLEKAIDHICKKQQSSWKWKGVIGQIPPLSFFQEAMEQDTGLFLYCGHGGGESCFSRSRVEEMLFHRKVPGSAGCNNNAYRQCRSSIILMGCSSGCLSSGGNLETEKKAASGYYFYEPEGIATWYLMAGAPCVVGNLWDVTDRDIDRYCIELLERFFADENQSCIDPNYRGSFRSECNTSSLAQCVADARDACKMRYIVGCAPVCYGVPVYIVRKSV